MFVLILLLPWVVSANEQLLGSTPVCSDGQGPLLEEGDAFNCDRGCPDGFDCEYLLERQASESGICCPNITRLYELYGADDEKLDKTLKTKHTEVRSRLSLDDMDHSSGNEPERLESEEENFSGDSEPKPETFVQQKKRIHAAPILEDVELSEAKLEKSILPESAAEFDPEAGKPGMTAVSRPRGHRKTLKQRNFVLYGGLNVSEPEEGEVVSLSCDKQPYELTCRDGSVQTQATIRWYLAKDGECSYYPWGYCPGDLVVLSPTLRTKESCERVCLGQQSNKDSSAETEFLTDGSASSVDKSVDVQMSAETLDEVGAETSPDEVLDQSNPLYDTRHAIQPPGFEDEEGFKRVVARRAKPEIRPTRRDVDDEKARHSQGLKEDEEVANLEDNNTNIGRFRRLLNSSAEISEIEVNEQIDSKPESLPKVTDESFDLTKKHPKSLSKRPQGKGKVSRENTNDVSGDFSLDEDDGVTYEQEEKGVRLLCHRVPYRDLCRVTEMPSQFVLRWFFDARTGKCCSFPYGYCRAEEAASGQRHPLSKAECERLCHPARLLRRLRRGL